ncbi:hypothetical protein SAMN04515647_3444 [Cohaesibacter sp. ES.047]|nr:hypothetical protein SAMN04515647_3444 [Cohaesibacter sp. ES.047]
MDPTQNQSTTSVFDAAGSGFLDLALLGLVVAAALGYLYIKLWRGRGACSSCPTGGPGCSGCSTSNFEFDSETPLDPPFGGQDAPKRNGD